MAIAGSRKDRPAPWMLYGVLVGLGIFLIHNLIEFSFLETGPMMLALTLMGAALGIRQQGAGDKPRRGAAMAWLAAAGIAWVAVAGALAIPTLRAEENAHDADDLLAADNPRAAARLYSRAFDFQPLNADYLVNAAWAELCDPDDPMAPARAIQFLDRAIATDPASVPYYLLRAHVLWKNRPADALTRRQIIADFESALRLDPRQVSNRLDYARTLAEMDQPADAAREFERAFEDNDLLDRAEPKRLAPQREIPARLEWAACLQRIGKNDEAAGQLRKIDQINRTLPENQRFNPDDLRQGITP